MKRLKYILLITSSFLFLNLCFLNVYASEVNCENDIKSAVCEDNEKGDIYKDYHQYQEVFNHHRTSNPIVSGFNILGWWIIQGLATISNVLHEANVFLYDVTKEFIESDYIENMSKTMNQISFATLPIMIMTLSMLGMFGRHDKLKQGIMQVLIAMVFIQGVGYIYEQGFALIPAMDTVFKSETEDSYADELLLDSIIDIEYLKEAIDDGKDISGRKNRMTFEELQYLDVNQPAPYEKSRWLGMVKERYFNRIIVGWDNENQVPLLRAYDAEGLWGFGKTFVHKYDISYIEIMLSLFVLVIGQLFIEAQRIKIILELGVARIFSSFVAILSITNKQKLMRFITKLFQLFSGVMLTTFSITYYIKFAGYIASADINFFAKLPLMYANVVFLFNASEIVNMLFGVQSGAGSNFLRKYLGAKAITGVSRGVSNFVQGRVEAYNKQKDDNNKDYLKMKGENFGTDLANSRANFLNEEGTTIADYKDRPELQSDYEYQPLTKEELAKDMKGGDTPKGYKKNLQVAEKHLKAFNEAGKEAYEQQFPTYRERRYNTGAKEDIERKYPTKYNRDFNREVEEKARRYNEEQGKRVERASNFDDQKISEAEMRQTEQLWKELDEDV
jgi:hypothetical protein